MAYMRHMINWEKGLTGLFKLSRKDEGYHHLVNNMKTCTQYPVTCFKYEIMLKHYTTSKKYQQFTFSRC